MDVRVQPVPQRRGGVKYIVDSRQNALSNITFQPGGLYGNDGLISVQLGTALEDDASLQLFRLFYERLFNGFVKVKIYYVGPEALGCLP